MLVRLTSLNSRTGQTLSLPEFWREAQVEALNYAKARGLGEVPCITL
jgi:hypothetical protein